ncbi:hypothetical protein H4219_006051, partial [Mycoemilia scoparia]
MLRSIFPRITGSLRGYTRVTFHQHELESLRSIFPIIAGPLRVCTRLTFQQHELELLRETLNGNSAKLKNPVQVSCTYQREDGTSGKVTRYIIFNQNEKDQFARLGRKLETPSPSPPTSACGNTISSCSDGGNGSKVVEFGKDVISDFSAALDSGVIRMKNDNEDGMNP